MTPQLGSPMDPENNSPAPTPASDIPRSDIEMLEQVELRRLEIARQQPTPLKISEFPMLEAALNTPPKTPEQLEEAERRRAEYQAKAQRESREQSVCELSGSAGARYRSCSLETFAATHSNQIKAKRALGEYLEMLSGNLADGAGLVLYGPVGTGKDHLAFAVCRAAILEHGKSVRWINGQSWFGEIRDNIETGENEARVIERLTRSDILVVSDPLPPKIGERFTLTTHQATMLYRLIDARYSIGVPTICTVNGKDGADIEARLGAATWDRLCHGSWLIHCAWPTHRKPAREIN